MTDLSVFMSGKKSHRNSAVIFAFRRCHRIVTGYVQRGLANESAIKTHSKSFTTFIRGLIHSGCEKIALLMTKGRNKSRGKSTLVSPLAKIHANDFSAYPRVTMTKNIHGGNDACVSRANREAERKKERKTKNDVGRN